MTGLVLHDLQRFWGGAYLTTGAAGHWIAHRRDNGRMIIARSPAELHELLAEDHGAQPAAYEKRRGSHHEQP